MKKLNLVIALLATISTAAFAAGGDASGGGNTVNSKLIEEFTIEPESLGDGYKLAQEYLENIKDAAPSFGKDLESASKNIVWYSLPKKFRELPASVTGLNFPSDQPLYQNYNEIFISAEDFPKLKPEAQAKVLMHEFVMMDTPGKHGYMVRQLMTFLIKNNFKPSEEDLVKKLKALGYGEYLLKSEFAEVKANAVQNAKRDLNDILFDSIEKCQYLFILHHYAFSDAIYKVNEKINRPITTIKSRERDYMLDVYTRDFFKSIVTSKAFQDLKLSTKLLFDWQERKQKIAGTPKEEKEKYTQQGCAAAKELQDMVSQIDDPSSIINGALPEPTRTPSSAMIESKNIPIKQNATAGGNTQAEQTDAQSTK